MPLVVNRCECDLERGLIKFLLLCILSLRQHAQDKSMTNEMVMIFLFVYFAQK